MRVNANAARSRPSLGVNILVTEGGIGPRLAGAYHQCLEVVLASKADRDGAVILVVIIDLAARHWAAGNEIDESPRRQRAGIPFAVVTRLRLLWSVDAEQADALTTKLYGIAIGDRKAMQGSSAVDVGLGECRQQPVRRLIKSTSAKDACWTRVVSGWLLPGVPEAGVVPDLGEGRIAGAKLVSDTLDCGTHIRPITVSPVSGNEAFMAKSVVNGAVGHELGGVRHQQMDDIVFTEGEVEIDVVPIGAADLRFENELVAHHALVYLRSGRGLVGFDHALETPDQNLHAACLVDKVDGASIESQAFVGGQGPSGQEHHRQVYAAPAQLRQQVDAQGLGKTPVEDDDIGIDGRIERAKQRGPIGKATDGKSLLRQLTAENVAVDFVVFEEKDANGVRLAGGGEKRG